LQPDIPPDQLERIRAIVDPLLADLRRRAQDLPSQSDLALVYELDAEAGQ
jgi:hypothetical protein